jgi:predicted nucleic acid-binding protein
MPAKGSRFGLDSNVLIALLCDWHEHHRKTLTSYERWLRKHAIPVIPVQAILECYSVLTRLPAPHRLPPEATRLAIEETFSRTAVIAELSPETAWGAIDKLARLGFGGGRVYDAAIAECVVKAGATVLLTWNRKHFLPITPAGLEVQEP